MEASGAQLKAIIDEAFAKEEFASAVKTKNKKSWLRFQLAAFYFKLNLLS